MYYDSHTHLNSPELFPKYEELLANFIKIWWKKLVNVWVDKERTQRALEIQKNYPEYCLSTVWFHPSEVIFKRKWNKFLFWKETLFWDEFLQAIENYIRELVENKLVIAIWECWLDYHYTEKDGGKLSKDSIEKQKELFILQCKLAQEYDIPLVIHSRDAFEDSVEILKDFKELKIYFHCWGYWPEEIKIIVDLFPNLRVGFDWNITYKKADDLRDSIKLLPFEKILLETDAPYLTPQIIRKEQNQPANIKYIYEYVSNLLNIPELELQKIIEENFYNYYFWELRT